MHSSVSPRVALFPPHLFILILILVAKASIQAEGINDNADEDDKSDNNSSELTQLSWVVLVSAATYQGWWAIALC